jgi:hypothetical protein
LRERNVGELFEVLHRLFVPFNGSFKSVPIRLALCQSKFQILDDRLAEMRVIKKK